MLNKKYLSICAIIIIFLFAVSSVSATNLNDDNVVSDNEYMDFEGNSVDLMVNVDNSMDDNDNKLSEENTIGDKQETNSLNEANNIIVNEKTFSSIQSAIDNANENDTVILDGYYTNDLENQSIIIDKKLNIVGINNATLDYANDHDYSFGILRICEENISIKGITFLNGVEGSIRSSYALNIDGCSFINSFATVGGAVYLSGNAKVTITNSCFENNSCSSQYGMGGGAIFLDLDASLNMNNCTFKNNKGYCGGAIYMSYRAYYSADIKSTSTVLINNSYFEGNSADYPGGAIFDGANKTTILFSQFINNNCTSEYQGNGGAIYSRNFLNMKNCSFISNEANICGGAIFSDCNESFIINCSFNNNSAEKAGDIFCNGTANIQDCIFENYSVMFISYLTVNDLVVPFGEDGFLIANLSSIYGPLPNKLITFTINGSNFTDITDSNGLASLNIADCINTHGVYTVEISFSGDDLYDFVSKSTTVFVTSTITVEEKTFSAIQTAIDNANDYDTIILDGYYVNDLENKSIQINKTLNFVGINDAILDYYNSRGDRQRIFNISKEGVNINNITFLNADYHYGSYYGSTIEEGGSAIFSSGSLSIENCRFINNSADVQGGAVYVCGDSSFNISNSYFEGNPHRAISVGAFTNLIVDNCTFLNNSNNGFGGAICLVSYENVKGSYYSSLRKSNNTVLINNSYFEGNNGTRGGAIYNGAYNATIVNSHFIDNRGNDYYSGGGAISSNNPISIINCSFENNSCLNKNGDGGAIYSYNSSYIKDCSFSNNHGVTKGGAIYCVYNSSSIVNCSFTNCSSDYGGAIFINRLSSYLNIFNCNFTDNSALSNGGAINIGMLNSSNIINCNFTNCSSKDGGAISFNKSSFNLNLSNCNFNDNYAERSGAALYELGENGTIFNCTFANNKCSYFDGAIFTHINPTSTNIIQTTFINNADIYVAESPGFTYVPKTVDEIIYLADFADDGDTIVLNGICRINSTIYINKSLNFIGMNNAVLTKNPTFTGDLFSGNSNQNILTLRNITFKNNSGRIINYCSADIDNCTFINNKFKNSYYSSGNSFYNMGDLTLKNSYFEDNDSPFDISCSLVIDNCNFINHSLSICNARSGAIITIYNSNFKDCSNYNQDTVKSNIFSSTGKGVVTIVNSSFEDNFVSGNYYMISTDGSINIIDSIFNNNTSMGRGIIHAERGINIVNSNFTENWVFSDYGIIDIVCSGDMKTIQALEKIIENCSFINDYSDSCGAIQLTNVAGLNLTDCEFIKSTRNIGGAIRLINSTLISINNCDFINCSAEDGGAIYIDENCLNVIISDSKFINNSISGDDLSENNGGGAILSLSNDLTIDNSTFLSNQALNSYGGAIRLIVNNENPVSTIVKNSVFLDNNALKGKSVYADDGIDFISNSFLYLSEDDCEDIAFGVSEDVLSQSNSFIESKLNSTINAQDIIVIYGESIIIPIGSEFVDSLHIRIINKNNAVIYEDELPIGDNLTIPQLPAGNYRVILDSIVDERVINPSSHESGLIIQPASSSVSASSVSAVYGKKVSINVLSNNATGIKYVIKNAKGSTVKSGTVASGKAISGLILAAGTYTLSLSTIVDANHSTSSASSKITINKAAAKITAKALTTYYNSGKKWSITLKDTTNSKLLSKQKITLKVYTGKKYKTYKVTTNSKGVATFKASTLVPGKHKVIVSYSNGNYTTKSVTTTLKVNKMALSYKVSKSTQKDGASLQIWVKNKATKKAINKIKIKLLVYTGKKYKTISLISGKYSSKGNGYVGYAVKGPVYSVGTHTVKIMSGDSYHTGSVKSSLVLKSTVKKYSKKTITISKGKRTVKKG